MDGDVVAIVLGPLTTALVAGLGVALRAWYRRWDRGHRGRRALALARDEVAFVDAWADARARLAPDTDRPSAAEVDRDLEHALRLARHGVELCAPEPAGGARAMAASLLLLRRLRHRPARALRLGYHACLVWLVGWAAAESWRAMDAGGSSAAVLAAVVGVLLGGVLPAWLLRGLTLRTEAGTGAAAGRRGDRVPAGAGPPRPAVPSEVDVRERTRGAPGRPPPG